MRVYRCPECGTRIEDPEQMEPVELRAVLGLVGLKKGWRGPLPVGKFARLVRSSPRSLAYYLAGEREIPPLVAREARRLREMVTQDPDRLQLPRKWEEQRDAMLRRKARARRLVELHKRTPEPPF